MKWHKNPGYLPIDPETRIHGRLEGESKKEATEYNTRAGAYRWGIDESHANLIEYVIVGES